MENRGFSFLNDRFSPKADMQIEIAQKLAGMSGLPAEAAVRLELSERAATDPL